MAKAHKNVNTSGLKMWKKGQSGNPAGRPKKLQKLETILREELGAIEGEDQEAAIRKIIRNMVKEATSRDPFNKNVQAAQLLLNRAYGKEADALQDPEEAPKQITGFIITERK
jgi:hypothetical protein